jgi:hypothetical protein
VEEAALEAVRARHKRVSVVSFGQFEIVLRAPTRGEYKAYRAAMHTPGGSADATEDLVRKTVVWCNGTGETDQSAREAFDKLLDEYPGLCENRAASKEIMAFTGIEFGAQGKG